MAQFFIDKGSGNVITINYADITNKPSINGVTLESNKTSAQLGLVEAEAGKGLSTNDFTSAEKSKLAGITAGAQENLIENITVNGVAQIINNKTVALTVITNTVDNLINYYKKSETYTQSEVNALISAIPKFDIKVVDTLPTTDISNSTVYLLRTSDTESGNLYTEYIYVEASSGTFQWEKLGTQTLDLSDYVTTTELNIALASYTTTTNLNALLSSKVDKVNGKGLSTNDYTTSEKNKLSGIANGAEVNAINKITVNNLEKNIINKTVAFDVMSYSELAKKFGYTITHDLSDRTGFVYGHLYSNGCAMMIPFQNSFGGYNGYFVDMFLPNQYSTDITTAFVPDGTEYIRRAFDSCINLTHITLPDSLKGILNNAFSISGIISIDIPENVTVIGDQAFQYCSHLSSIYLPISLTKFGSNVFYNSTNLTDIYYAGTQSQWQSIDGLSEASIPSAATIHYEYIG